MKCKQPLRRFPVPAKCQADADERHQRQHGQQDEGVPTAVAGGGGELPRVGPLGGGNEAGGDGGADGAGQLLQGVEYGVAIGRAVARQGGEAVGGGVADGETLAEAVSGVDAHEEGGGQYLSEGGEGNQGGEQEERAAQDGFARAEAVVHGAADGGDAGAEQAAGQEQQAGQGGTGAVGKLGVIGDEVAQRQHAELDEQDKQHALHKDRIGEDAQVDERCAAAQRADDEEGQGDGGERQQSADCAAEPAMCGSFFGGEDEAAESNDQQEVVGQVDFFRCQRADGLDAGNTERERDEQYRQQDEEDGAPAVAVDNHPGQYRPDRRRHRHNQRGDAHDEADAGLRCLGQDDVEHQRQSDAGARALQDAAAQEQGVVGGKGAEQGAGDEDEAGGGEEGFGGEVFVEPGRERDDERQHQQVGGGQPLHG